MRGKTKKSWERLRDCLSGGEGGKEYTLDNEKINVWFRVAGMVHGEAVVDKCLGVNSGVGEEKKKSLGKRGENGRLI